MRHWFKDHAFSLAAEEQRLSRCVARSSRRMCWLATLAFAGRGLGVVMFGMLILIVSYAKAVSGISKFQSWQLIVRYGGHASRRGRARAIQGVDRLRLRAGHGERHRRE